MVFLCFGFVECLEFGGLVVGEFGLVFEVLEFVVDAVILAFDDFVLFY